MSELLSASIQSYVGRTVDYLAFDEAKLTRTRLTQRLVLPGQSGALIAGIEKLTQRFLLELLTEQGSLEYQPSRGTFFITEIRAGAIRTSQQLISSFSSAELTLRNSLVQEELDSDPADERYRSAVLNSAAVSGDTATLDITLSSQAGESRTVIYPLRINT